MVDSAKMIRDLILQQRELIFDSLDNFDPIPMQRLAESIAKCEGIVVFTGVGKSAFIAKKVAMTFVSCGTKAVFLSPTDALHGDIGMVDSKDWVVAISRSGESDELIQLAPFVKSRGARLAAIVGQSQSRLGAHADLVVVTPYQRELGAIQMVPTTSAELQLIYMDILAVAVTQIKGISIEDFARNHPAGQIGKRLTLRVRDLMLTGSHVPYAREYQTISSTLIDLSNKRSGCLVIVDEHYHLMGIFTDGDLRRSLEKYGKDTLDMTVGELMNRSARAIDADRLAHDALIAMEMDRKRPITAMPVLHDERVVGLIRMHDLLQAGI